MPTNRIGFSSDFVLSNSRVGIATTNPSVTLQVAGVAKGDYHITGISTLASYGGFVSQKQNISLASTIGFTTTGIGTVGITSFISVNEVETGFVSLVGEFNTLAEDLIIDEGRIFDVSTIRNIGITTLGTQSVYVPNGSTVCVGKLESVNIGAHFSVPNGGIAARTQNPVEGMVRFNNDLNTLEFYNGVEWRQFTVTGASGRGVFAGGIFSGAYNSNISYVNISSQGNALDFGVLTNVSRTQQGGFSSSIRGIYHLGMYGPLAQSNILEYITIASQGNSIDFGDLTSPARNRTTAISNSNRGIVVGGFTPTPTLTTFNTLDYVQISTLGNALDFGDLIRQLIVPGASSSPTRGVFVGGYSPSASNISESSFITISSTGNAVDFGNYIFNGAYISNGVSNGVRGIFAGGSTVPYLRKDIAYVTFSSLGNAVYFGDLSVPKSHFSGCSNSTRGVFNGGDTPTIVNTLEFITITSTGNAQDFGDDSFPIGRRAACSDSHGGLGGF